MRSPGQAFRIAVPLLVTCFGLACLPVVNAAATQLELTPEEAAVLAERFAPLLVFHPSEEYFPTNPLFPLNGLTANQADPVAVLGTPESRREYYRALTVAEKDGLATVYYRAYPTRHDSEEVVVLEYWFYYVQNDYRLRVNVMPFSFNGSHPNDLEHVHIVLRTDSDTGSGSATDPSVTGYRLDTVYASAHEGDIPANRYTYSEEATTERLRLLVELGSHALAPDIDQDGLFTPGSDGDSGHKLLWGIRDRGTTWTRYKRAYMDPRTDGEAPVMASRGSPHLVDTEPRDASLAYTLVPVDRLREDFDRLGLTDEEREAIFEERRGWVNRAFGGNNGASEKLLVPPERSLQETSIGIDDYASTETGFLVGSTFNLDTQGVYVGARYAVLNGNQWLPDLLLQADGVAATQGTSHAQVQFLMSYPIDSYTKLMGGSALVTDSIRLDRHQWDWVGGMEVRLGNMRLYAGARSERAILKSPFEFRLSYFF